MTRDEVATTWRELVLKHTKGGACNFQDAAHELAEIVQTALKAALAEPVQEPVDFVFLLREADEIVRGKPTWKRFIDGTPLSNDIAVWMTVFAQDVARRAALRSALAKPVQEPVAWGGDPSVQDYSSCYPEPVQEPVNYTTGHCKNRKQKGGCQLHNLQCGWPDCDRVDVAAQGSAATEYRYELPSPTDPYATTRRAIVRAAAEIERTTT